MESQITDSAQPAENALDTAYNELRQIEAAEKDVLVRGRDSQMAYMRAWRVKLREIDYDTTREQATLFNRQQDEAMKAYNLALKDLGQQRTSIRVTIN